MQKLMTFLVERVEDGAYLSTEQILEKARERLVSGDLKEPFGCYDYTLSIGPIVTPVALVDGPAETLSLLDDPVEYVEINVWA